MMKMTDREFLNRVLKELQEIYEFFDEEKQTAYDIGQIAGLITLHIEINGEGENNDEE